MMLFPFFIFSFQIYQEKKQFNSFIGKFKANLNMFLYSTPEISEFLIPHRNWWAHASELQNTKFNRKFIQIFCNL